MLRSFSRRCSCSSTPHPAFIRGSEKRFAAALVFSPHHQSLYQRQQQVCFSQQQPINSNPNPNEEGKLAPESKPTPTPTSTEGAPTMMTDEVKEKIKEKLEKKENLRWKPGQKLTNSQLLELFNSYSQKNKIHGGDQMKKMLQHPILHVYGFDRREFIKGCKQALLMISESVSSPRFQAFTKG
jgi:hypothetical protein